MLKLRPYLAKSLTIMLLMVLAFYAWLFNYPNRLIKHLFLGMWLSITLKAEVEQLRWLLGGGGHSSVVRATMAKAGDLGWIPGSCLVFFFSSWLTNVEGMKDLWCCSTV